MDNCRTSTKDDLLNKVGSEDNLSDHSCSLDSPRLALQSYSHENNEHSSNGKLKHVLEVVDCDSHSALVKVVTAALRSTGIENENSSRSRSKTRNPPRQNGLHENTGMHKLVEASLRYSDVKVCIPFLLKESCEYIRQHIRTQGIFRKSGSSARAQSIWQRFIQQEANVFSTNDTVFEVASVVKQYLREMTVPLIPFELQTILLKCLDCTYGIARIENLLIAVCLLPIANLSILSYLMEFLHEVAQHSQQNNMGYKNLAIVIGPNIMPVQRKGEKSKGALNNEMKLLEVHAKVIEILIQYGDFVGFISFQIEKSLEDYLMPKNSEDELEAEGGKRKKRRSGSLTRMLGFLKKVTNGKGGDTPTASTPGDIGNYTPVIKDSTKKRIREDFPFSQSKNPMKLDWKQTPNGVRLKNLVTPSLLRRKGKRSPGSSGKDLQASSESTKLAKPKLGFGKKASKKKVISRPSDARTLGNQRAAISTVSIHRLASSPRAAKIISFSTRIPKPEYSTHSLRRANSSSILKNEVGPLKLADTTDGSGEYVTISSTATVNDEKNEAFIASSISFNDSYDILENSHQTSSSTDKLNLSPLIQEIDHLTLCAQREDFDFSKMVVSSQDSEAIPSTSPRSSNLDKIEDKFNKAMKESKIINIVNGSDTKEGASLLQRRFSVQEKGVSPSQRKIRAVRRKSHEIGRVTPVVTEAPKFMSLRSPKSRPIPPPLTRSSSRCTLRRGRPNTVRVGLARPSPVRGNNAKLNSSITLCIPPLKHKNVIVTNNANYKKASPKGSTAHTPEARPDFQFPIPTPLRRMSSVHELVQIMENTAKNTVTTAICHAYNGNAHKPVGRTHADAETRSRPTKIPTPTYPLSPEEIMWTDGMQFNFNNRLRSSDKRSKVERDSIHVLKTLNAGKVSENVKLFDGLHNNSPSKSMIPRLTSLHTATACTANDTNASNTRKGGSLYIKADARGRAVLPSETRRMIRRFSAVELKNKHEQKLETVKKEITVRRSVTTSGTTNTKTFKDRINTRKGNGNSPKERIPTNKSKRKLSDVKTVDPAQENLQSQEKFGIILEDEPLTASVQKAIQNILGSKLDFSEEVKNKINLSHGSPLKSSNLANVNKDNFISPCNVKSPISITRVASERGTKCTSSSLSVRSTPRIKKALTIRAYDMINSPRSSNNDFYTPKRPNKIMTRDLGLNTLSNQTPLKANHNIVH